MLTAILLLSFLSADEKEADDALERFKAAYKGAAAARASAVSDLARTPHEKTLVKLEGILGGEELPVRIAAAKGLGNFTDYKKKVTPVLLGVLASTGKDTVSLAEAIFEALGKLGDETALESVHKHFDDKDEKFVKAALGAAGDIKSSKSIDPIIELLKKYDKILGEDKNDKKGKGSGGGGVGVPYGGGGGDDPQRKLAKDTRPACIKALIAITKEKWTTSQEWVIWWSKHKGDSGNK
jgi:HEAT repeat protein